MAVSARGPDAGVAWRTALVVAALIGSLVTWQLATERSLRLSHVLWLAVGLRILFLPLLPTLSDDGFRYIWDGLLTVRHGIGAYAFPPDAPELSFLQDDVIYSNLNSPSYYSVYPPVSQAIFAAGAMLYGWGWQASWLGIKGIMVALEGIGIACLSRVVDARGVALYALHPIAIVEVAGQGHTEGALVCALGIAIVALSRRDRWTTTAVAGVALALSGWVKLYPFALGMVLGRRWIGWLAWGGVAVSGALWVGVDGVHILESVALYGTSLDFYAMPYMVLKALLYPLLGDASGSVARGLLTLSWGIVLLGLAATLDGRARTAIRAIAIGVTAFALTSSVQHPWNWIGVLYVMPLLQVRWTYWLASWSLLTYLRYVGLDEAYVAALIIGWGGALLWVLLRRGRLREQPPGSILA